MKRLLRVTIWAVIAVCVMWLFAEMTWNALGQLDYKMCKQIPNNTEDCEKRRP